MEQNIYISLITKLKVQLNEMKHNDVRCLAKAYLSTLGFSKSFRFPKASILFIYFLWVPNYTVECHTYPLQNTVAPMPPTLATPEYDRNKANRKPYSLKLFSLHNLVNNQHTISHKNKINSWVFVNGDW